MGDELDMESLSQSSSYPTDEVDMPVSWLIGWPPPLASPATEEEAPAGTSVEDPPSTELRDFSPSSRFRAWAGGSRIQTSPSSQTSSAPQSLAEHTSPSRSVVKLSPFGTIVLSLPSFQRSTPPAMTSTSPSSRVALCTQRPSKRPGSAAAVVLGFSRVCSAEMPRRLAVCEASASRSASQRRLSVSSSVSHSSSFGPFASASPSGETSPTRSEVGRGGRSNASEVWRSSCRAGAEAASSGFGSPAMESGEPGCERSISEAGPLSVRRRSPIMKRSPRPTSVTAESVSGRRGRSGGSVLGAGGPLRPPIASFSKGSRCKRCRAL
mmetsp:Transcript_20482/g.52234  ORF Transcript_20482/g.52234 Transcript_20482/m.52234 type:complete len:324 (+) Transcript_20482:129-1100(+)